MVEYYFHSAGRSFGGVEIFRYKIVLPRFSDSTGITDFYRGIYDRVIEYCEGQLGGYAEKKYTECDIPRKRFDYPPLIYRLDGRVTYTVGDLLFVKLTASVSQRNLSDTVTVYDAHAWSLTDARLIPPKMAAREYYKGGSFGQIGKNGFLVENGKGYICYPDRLSPITIKKQTKRP